MLALLGGLSGCGGKETTTSDVFTNPKTRWLAGEPCAPPCWENIQPGVTRPEEAVEFLKASPSIDSTSVQVTELPDGGIGLAIWKFSSAITSWTGKVGYDSELDSVQAITLMAPDLCLNEIIGAYGEPDYLFLTRYEITGTIDLIWRSYGFIYEVQGHSPGEPITENTCNGGLMQFSVGTPFQKMPAPTFMVVGDDAFVPWTGYGRYGG